MANKILKDYQGESIKIGGVCYQYGGTTVSSVDTLASEIEGTFASCLECALESSSSSSSSSSEMYSESSSSSESGGGAPAPKNCSGDPDIILKVTANPGDFPITWCGETWTVGENGTEKRVCPTIYTLNKSKMNPGTNTWTIDATHSWGYNNSLILKRNLNASYYMNPATYFFVTYKINFLKLLNTLTDGRVASAFFTNSTPGAISPYASDLNMILGVAMPTYPTGYRIANSTSSTASNPWFSNHSVGTINYAWRRGDNWPA